MFQNLDLSRVAGFFLEGIKILIIFYTGLLFFPRVVAGMYGWLIDEECGW